MIKSTDKYKLVKAARNAEENGDAEWAKAIKVHLAVVSTYYIRQQ